MTISGPPVAFRSARFVALALTLVVATACSRGVMRGTSDTDDAKVRVENRGWVDMTIYVVQGGVDRRRLGVAAATGATTMTIPASFVGQGRDLQFLADPVGGRGSSVTQRLFVRPGDEVVLMIQP